MRVKQDQVNESRPADKPKKPKKRRIRLLIIIIIILVVLLIILGVTGLYKIPVISHLFQTYKPKDLGIKTSEQALISLADKIPMELIGTKSELCVGCNRSFEGIIEVEAEITSEEITSFLEKRIDDQVLDDIQVKKVEGGYEISSMVKKPIKAPVYVKIEVKPTGEKSVKLNITKGRIGLIPVPKGYLEKASDWLEEKVNLRLSMIESFSIEKLEYHDGYTEFIGTFPKKVKPRPGKWLDFLTK